MDRKLLNDRYRLVELIGSGGMATIYKGVDTLLHRPVAIKILREAYASDPVFLARFQQEARAAARLDHPNVVTIYDVGQDGELHYIVMEYVEGEDLKTLIRRKERLSIEESVNIAAQIAAGVGHAHREEIIHCDIKPHNVLITEDGVAKVTDFGIARALSESGLTDSETVWGSPLYFSPEQAAGERPKPASDVYSIGVVLYEMLAGVPPFQAEKPTALALMHMREEPPPLSAINPKVPPQLEWIVRKVLAKEPSARYRTAEQLALVLQEYRAHGEEVTGLHEIQDEIKQASGVYPSQVPPSGSVALAEGPDWRTWVLAAVAAIAVIGLIPLWALVYRAWTRSTAPPGSPLLMTPTPTVAMVLVPDVQGRHWEEARGELETAGLRFELEEEPEATEPEGTIVRLDPGPGESVPTGSQVRLYIAGPPEMVEMPGVVDVPVEMARNWLEEARLQVIEEPIWSTRPISTVLAQEPERGTRVQAGSVVTLTISGGTDAPIEINATLGNAIVLEKAELRQALLSPGDVLIVSLRWRPLTTIDTRYVVFVHLISPAGDLVAQEDVEPLRGNQPTNTWTEEIPLWDRHQVQVPASAPAGTYEVRTGMYPQGRPGDRLSVVDPGEASVETDSILVAEVEVRRR
ncbi:MAG: Stk1 family PASTA domain-containing Ser/Thr kinase [Anaerolineae bacterium]|jgi:serine/threonine-protein kinase